MCVFPVHGSDETNFFDNEVSEYEVVGRFLVWKIMVLFVFFFSSGSVVLKKQQQQQSNHHNSSFHSKINNNSSVSTRIGKLDSSVTPTKFSATENSSAISSVVTSPTSSVRSKRSGMHQPSIKTGHNGKNSL